MYNEEAKINFLKDKGLLTQREYESFFNKSEEYEHAHSKDISEFTFDELENMLMNIKPRNEKQAKVYCSIINGYRRFIYNNQDNIFSNVKEDFYNQFT